jgi:hypothetical protein
MGKRHREAVRRFEVSEGREGQVPESPEQSETPRDGRVPSPPSRALKGGYGADHKFLQPVTPGLNEGGYANTHLQLASVLGRQRFILGNHPASIEAHTHLSTSARELTFQGIVNVLCHEGQHEALQRLLADAALSGRDEEARELIVANQWLDTPAALFIGIEGCLGHLDVELDFFRPEGFDYPEWQRLTDQYHFMSSCRRVTVEGTDGTEWEFVT